MNSVAIFTREIIRDPILGIKKTMKLDQFLKWKNLVSSGGEAKTFIKSGSVKVNGVIETRRGRKLNKGDKVIFLKNELIFE